MAEHFIPDIFIEFPGAEGEATVKGYEKTIAVRSYNFDVTATTTLGHGAGQMGGKGTMSPISLTLVHDKGFAKLRKLAAQGKITTSAVKVSRLADGKKKEEISLTKAKVVSAGSSHSSGASDSARVTLSFEKAEVTTYMEENGTTVTADQTTYNLSEGETT